MAKRKDDVRNKGEYIQRYGAAGGATPTYTAEEGPPPIDNTAAYAVQGIDPYTSGYTPMYGGEPNDPFNPRVQYAYDEYAMAPGTASTGLPAGYNLALGAVQRGRAADIYDTNIVLPSTTDSDAMLLRTQGALSDMDLYGNEAYTTLQDQRDWGEYLRAVAEGKAGPSAAELERERALGQSQRQALAIAASARQPGAYRSAFDAQEQMANQAASDAMIARANEMAAARTAYDANLAGTADTASTAAAIAQGRGTIANDAAEIEWRQAKETADSRAGQRKDIWDATNDAEATAAGYTAQEGTWATADTDARLRAEELKQKALADQAALRNQNDQFNAQQKGKTTSGFLGAAGSILGAMSLSDVRAKENIAPFPAEQAQDDLRRMPIYSYQYRDPAAVGAAPGQQVGPMAQELRRLPTFRGAAQPGEDGMLRLDPNRLTLGTLSAQKGQQDQLDEQSAELERMNAELEQLRQKSGREILGFQDQPAERPSYEVALPRQQTSTAPVSGGNLMSQVFGAFR